ncbi:MAG: helix-turn-helix transcriptional regulator [Sedimentibacter sp.]|jgi:transcriptional regulator with XRE-family HTH domain
MILSNSIGFNIKTLREEKGLNQNQLVDRLLEKNIRMSRETLSKIENDNRTVSAIELAAICDILGVSYDEFFKEIDNGEDLTTLFRKKGNFDEATIEEIEVLQEMIKIFINHERIFKNEYNPKKREPLWRDF